MIRNMTCAERWGSWKTNSTTDDGGRSRRPSTILIWISAIAFFHTLPAQATETPEWSWKHDKGQSLSALCNHTVVWQFNYGKEQGKPFFHPVGLPDGSVLTWNSPPDHPWHHALWFSWKYINGVNYWERNKQTKKPDGHTVWSNVRIKTHDDGTALIRMHLDYRSPDQHTVLTEERTITVAAPDRSGRYHMDWTCAFTAGPKQVVLDRTPLPGEPGGKVYGGYAGLSVRFAKELTSRQVISNKGPVKFSPQSRYRGNAVAMDYNGEINGRPVGIAICDHPENLNHPSPWYVIRSKAMSYYSPAVICYRKHIIKAGEHLVLRYRVIVHPDRLQADQLQREYERFVQTAGRSRDTSHNSR